MTARRALMGVVTAAALALVALAAASLTAWARCGDGDCGGQLTLGIASLPLAMVCGVVAAWLFWRIGGASTARAVQPSSYSAAPGPRPRRALWPETQAAAFGDPEQVLRLNAVRDTARALDTGAFRLQQSSVRTMTAMMRLRRAMTVRDAAPADMPPAWMRRLPMTEPPVAATDDRRVIPIGR